MRHAHQLLCAGRHGARPLAWLTLALLWIMLPIAGCSDAPFGSKPSANDGQSKPSRPASEHLVTTITAERASVAVPHERPGSLRLRRLVRLHSQEEGRITELQVFEGDEVAPGQTLIRLEDDLLRAELDAARATAAQERLDLKRLEGLAGRGGASEDEIAQARTAVAVAEAQVRVLETRLAFTEISAPFAGLVTARLAEPGDFVTKNTHLLSIADPASLIAEVLVSELVLPQLSVGDPVQIRIDALGGLIVPGRILRIHPTLSETGRQAMVEIAFDQIPAGARDGQFVRVRFESRGIPRLMVPFRALRQDRDGPFVWIIDEAGEAQRQPVEIGVRITDQVEIVDGLEPGTQVITRGFLGLAAGKEVRAIETSRL